MEISIDKVNGDGVIVPVWYNAYVGKLRASETDLAQEIENISSMSMSEVNSHIGGNLEELPYEILGPLFIEGSDDEQVAELLRKRRAKYVEIHPEEYKGVPGAMEGVILCDGKFVSKADWDEATDSEKRGLVGRTCFHWVSDTPNMDSSPKDRW